jgi:hypothetical protein
VRWRRPIKRGEGGGVGVDFTACRVSNVELGVRTGDLVHGTSDILHERSRLDIHRQASWLFCDQGH